MGDAEILVTELGKPTGDWAQVTASSNYEMHDQTSSAQDLQAALHRSMESAWTSTRTAKRLPKAMTADPPL